MLLGQEFSGYVAQVEQSEKRIHAALEGVFDLPLGGTAIGTGLNAIPGFAAAVISELAQRSGLPFPTSAIECSLIAFACSRWKVLSSDALFRKPPSASSMG